MTRELTIRPVPTSAIPVSISIILLVIVASPA